MMLSRLCVTAYQFDVNGVGSLPVTQHELSSACPVVYGLEFSGRQLTRSSYLWYATGVQQQ